MLNKTLNFLSDPQRLEHTVAVGSNPQGGLKRFIKQSTLETTETQVTSPQLHRKGIFLTSLSAAANESSAGRKNQAGKKMTSGHCANASPIGQFQSGCYIEASI